MDTCSTPACYLCGATEAPDCPAVDQLFIKATVLHPQINLAEKPDGVHPKLEKYLLRKAFDLPEEPYLPDDVLFRQKEQVCMPPARRQLADPSKTAARHVCAFATDCCRRGSKLNAKLITNDSLDSPSLQCAICTTCTDCLLCLPTVQRRRGLRLGGRPQGLRSSYGQRHRLGGGSAAVP